MSHYLTQALDRHMTVSCWGCQCCCVQEEREWLVSPIWAWARLKMCCSFPRSPHSNPLEYHTYIHIILWYHTIQIIHQWLTEIYLTYTVQIGLCVLMSQCLNLSMSVYVSNCSRNIPRCCKSLHQDQFSFFSLVLQGYALQAYKDVYINFRSHKV